MSALVWASLTSFALAAAPTDLDGLVELALERDPARAAASLEILAAGSEALAARRPMNPMAMIGVDSLGAMPGDPDPTMFMFGATQMLRGWGEARAASSLARAEAARVGIERDRVAADLRLRLALAAARVQALEAERRLLDDQIRGAETLWQAGVRRWGSGASRPGMGPMRNMEEGRMDGGMNGPSTAPPAGRGSPPAYGGMDMPGMGGGGARSEAPPRGGVGTGADGDAMGGNAMSGDRMGGGAMAGGSTFPDLLRVEAEGARLRADAVALDAMLEGEVRVLSRFVGDEAAAAVQSQPSAFLEGSSTPPPELDLAAAERSVAEANLRVARARLAPDLELRASVGVMPDSMVQGVNVMLGVELPVWGAQARARDASAARLDAATRRAEVVERDVAAAFDAARAAERAAAARATVLRDVAEPRAGAAWQAALARYAAGQGTVDEALRAWEGLLAVRRHLIAAERDARMRAAERARVETP